MTDVVMPQMGESIVEGTLTKWLKKAGEHVDRDEPLFEISTDKVDTEIPSPAAGVLKEVLVEEGKTVAISTVVGRIEEGAGNGASAPAPQALRLFPLPRRPKPAPPPHLCPSRCAPVRACKRPQPPRRNRFQALRRSLSDSGSWKSPRRQAESAGPLSPLVRKMAREYNIDLRQVRAPAQADASPSRIWKRTCRRKAPGPWPSQARRRGPTTRFLPVYAPPATPAGPAPPAIMPRAEAPRARVEPMSVMRQRIAEHMVMSKRVSAHVTTVHKTDMTKIAKIARAYKAEFQQRYGYSLTFCRSSPKRPPSKPFTNTRS
jgi:pyruvate dehydrogenase E2 component (dihydrolipoamide acetyltransferase)